MTSSLPISRLLTDRAVRAAHDWLGPGDIGDALACIAWSVLIEPGDGIAGELIARLGARAALEAVGDADRMATDEARAALDRWRPRWDSALVIAAIDEARRRSLRLVTPDAPGWPAGFDDLGPHAPVALWVRGDAQTLSAASVAVVGARAATPYGEHVATEMSGELAAGGLTIVSGAAYGIDGAAHRAALRAGGTTVAFVAGGADRIYPSGHAHLLQEIAARGAVVAECPPGTTPTKWRFLARNRLIAAAAHGTVVVEAGGRSGSINTAGHAASLGRPLGAVPGPVTSSTSSGCHRLLREYDATCVTGAADVREMLGSPQEPQPLSYDSPDATRVGDALSRRPRTVDELARRSGLAPDDVTAVLGLMSLDGRAEARADGWVGTA